MHSSPQRTASPFPAFFCYRPIVLGPRLSGVNKQDSGTRTALLSTDDISLPVKPHHSLHTITQHWHPEQLKSCLFERQYVIQRNVTKTQRDLNRPEKLQVENSGGLY